MISRNELLLGGVELLLGGVELLLECVLVMSCLVQIRLLSGGIAGARDQCFDAGGQFL